VTPFQLKRLREQLGLSFDSLARLCSVAGYEFGATDAASWESGMASAPIPTVVVKILQPQMRYAPPGVS